MEGISAFPSNQPIDIFHIILQLEFPIKEKVLFLFLFWNGLRGPTSCSYLGGGVTNPEQRP